MRMLLFQAERFAWTPHARTLDDAEEPTGTRAEGHGVEEAVVAFLQVEAKDVDPEAPSDEAPPPVARRVFKKTLKHLKWLANKRGMGTVVLHSFAHLGGDNADPEVARRFLDELGTRLEATGYAVERTPFGWFHGWELSVYGDSLAKVWQAF